MTVYTAYFSFIMFVLLLLLINSYFLISLNVEKRKHKKIEKRKEEIKETFVSILEKKEANRVDEVNKLRDNFNRKTDIQAFHKAVREYYKSSDYKDELSQLLEEVVDINKIVKSGVVRKEYKESYALYLLSEFKMGNKETGDFALSSLDKKSLHIRNNALNVINKNNDLTIMMKAIDLIDSKEHYFNDKTIIDFLDNYKGDKDALDNDLYLNMNTYNTNLKKNIISHFINITDGTQKIKDRMLDYIQESSEKEIVISSTRYFNKIIDQRAVKYILNNMESEDWEVRATSARVICNYPGEQVIEKLKQTLKDENYYVRYNSAESFLKLVDEKAVIEEAVKNEDRFTRDILLYAMNTRGIITVEDYENLVIKSKEAENMEGVALI
ncbi:MAG: HEAT repeat domain-containing protein [Carnobacterium sp.]|uniref:HEAT repeat domain-containing protein n=1 Tax=Carnobacterium sp. TaxID=48221 RepID=UPI003C74748F